MMQLFSWSTGEVPQRQGFEYWREAVCRAVLDVSTAHPPTEAFEARITARRTESLTYASFCSSAHDIVRDRLGAARSGEETYLLSLQLAGVAEISQCGAQVTLTPGNMAIVESWRPFHVRLTGPVSRILAVVPRRMLAARIDGLRMIPGSVTFADLLRDYLRRLSDPSVEISRSTAQALGQNVCNLIDVIYSDEDKKRRATSEVRREMLLRYMKANLRDVRLSPGTAAAHLGVSLRSVHNLLRPTGETFGAWVLDQRLDACAGDLRDPALAGRRVADIAYAWGFADLSHFNHAFKARFGATPGDLRAGRSPAERA